MNNTKLLEQKIKESGYKKKYLAGQLNLSYCGFRKKVNNDSDFSSTEIATLCRLLNIKALAEKEKIFFAKR